MILGKIIAGLLAIVWDIEEAFVKVDFMNATVSRSGGTCTPGSVNVTITSCGQTLSDGLVNLIISGTNLLGQLVQALNINAVVRGS